MTQKLWVENKTTERTYGLTRVSIEGCEYVDDFLKEIKKESQLAIPKDSSITLYRPDGTEIDVGDSPTSFVVGNSRAVPLVVKATALAARLKSFRQERYKKMSVEASCRKYLDAIATKFSSFYEFDYRNKEGPTIGDVLAAKDGVEGEDWKFRRAVKTHHQTDEDGFTVEIRKGQPLAKDKLPDIYTSDEWDKISKFNKKTTKRVHDGQLPHLSNGKPYIIIPHSEFTEEMVSFLKIIGVKATLFSSPDDLEVKDEDVLSEGSSLA